MSLNAYPSSPAAPTTRKQFGRLSIAAGNLLQTVGIIIAFVALRAAQSAQRPALAIAGMISSWILLYFFAHAIAHWLIGWVLGIRFRFYTVGGTGNREGYPPGLRWIFEHLPFFGVQTDKSSMQEASPLARALMWSAGVTSSAFVRCRRCPRSESSKPVRHSTGRQSCRPPPPAETRWRWRVQRGDARASARPPCFPCAASWRSGPEPARAGWTEPRSALPPPPCR